MTTAVKQARSIRAMSETAEAREETFRGESYIVVPVVAMVEGVRFGAAQSEPELGLADVFAKYPAAWNGRPVVVNHPKVNGVHVSAGAPEVREDYEIGFTANAKRDGTRLKMEAWLNTDLLDTVDNTEIFLQKIEAKEMIEISVGFFADVVAQTGNYEGQDYAGVWQNVFSDHLAFLTSEKGACSIADGCGALRNNQAKEIAMTLRTDSSEDCGCGGKKTGTEGCTCHSEPQTQAQSDETPENSATARNAPKGETPESPPTVQSENEKQVSAEPENVEEFKVHSIADSVTAESIWATLRNALDLAIEGRAWLITFTAGENSVAVYETWNGDNYVNLGIRFNMDDDGKVTFEGEPFNVRIVSHLYTEQETPMTVQSEQTDPKVEGANGTQTPTVQTEAPKVLSQADALAAMDPADRAEIEAAMKVHASQKASAIKALKDSGRCNFDDEYLNAQSLGTLENLIELAAVPNYSGRAAPAPSEQPTVQSRANGGFAPAPEDIFATK